ncbi:4'-phosphopantetheinyl transferase superfamily protein [Methylomarinum sp. Ch1-1]|uniref:4'-phosphopantetheinyl transferase superfamily protein n=1 Tax=Methylomarinum roseum TaxID=3067653 RepID=A0AAU7NV51_9GAMM|nr:4'-phosphopantetheinyl transferase superfamily protein [Methylomarinum sp. Ch1-1]MDP4519095.1 4'-phosphopantetheinyl transferase superfamily protein [Methylomarinum sp. Ch1-1]
MLQQGYIELWHGVLSLSERDDEAYYALLDQQERRVADSMHRPSVRDRYLETRARLRLKLADYVGQLPEALAIARSEHGKPYLPDYPELSFNLSHSGDQLLLAVTAGSRLGVDVETVRPRSGMEGLARKCFAASELRDWKALPQEQQTIAFYRYWTAKEAFVKATGRGIGLGLNKVVVARAAPLRLVEIPMQYGDAGQWRLAAIALDEGLSATVCIDSPVLKGIDLYPWDAT